MPVKLPAPRHNTEDLSNSLIVTIPSPRKWYVIAYLILQILVWLVLELLVIGFVVLPWVEHKATGDGVLYLGAWLFLLTVLGFVAMYAFIWQVIGKERVELGSLSIKISRNLLWFIPPREYSAAHIKYMRVSFPSQSRIPGGLMFEAWGLVGGMIAFDYGAKTFRFGGALDEAEAKQIIAEIQQKFPQYKNQP